jgi:hypothetical protein
MQLGHHLPHYSTCKPELVFHRFRALNADWEKKEKEEKGKENSFKTMHPPLALSFIINNPSVFG